MSSSVRTNVVEFAPDAVIFERQSLPRQRQRENMAFIGKPKLAHLNMLDEKERRKWNGAPPTRVEREKLIWRATDIKF